MITIDGKRYTVTENLGYNHDAGGYAKFVMDGDREKLAVKLNKEWRFWTPADRAKPLIEGLERMAKEAKQRKVFEDES